MQALSGEEYLQRMDKREELAKGLFVAYNDEGPNPWKTFDGRDVPRWDALSDQVRGKWMAAAAVIEDASRSAGVLESIAASLEKMAVLSAEETAERKAMLADPTALTKYGIQIGRAVASELP